MRRKGSLIPHSSTPEHFIQGTAKHLQSATKRKSKVEYLQPQVPQMRIHPETAAKPNENQFSTRSLTSELLPKNNLSQCKKHHRSSASLLQLSRRTGSHHTHSNLKLAQQPCKVIVSNVSIERPQTQETMYHSVAVGIAALHPAPSPPPAAP